MQVQAQPDGVTDANQIYDASISNDAFTLTGLPAGNYDLTVTLPGYLPVTLSDVAVGAGATVDVGTLNLALAATISGSVISTDPNVPAAAELVGLYDAGNLVTTTSTDANGNFEFEGVSPGAYTLGVNPSSPLETDPTIIVTAGVNLSNVNINIVRGGTIAGQATDTVSGSPLRMWTSSPLTAQAT